MGHEDSGIHMDPGAGVYDTRLCVISGLRLGVRPGCGIFVFCVPA
jgi:hypothetical protein